MLRLRHALTRRGRLLVAPYAALAADATLTLLLQSSDYWSGRYEAASEAEVIGAMTLRLHPLAFVAWIAVWAVALAVVIALVPRIIARIACVAAALLHTFALLNWLLAWSSNPYVTFAGRGVVQRAKCRRDRSEAGSAPSLRRPHQRGLQRSAKPTVRIQLVGGGRGRHHRARFECAAGGSLRGCNGPLVSAQRAEGPTRVSPRRGPSFGRPSPDQPPGCQPSRRLGTNPSVIARWASSRRLAAPRWR